MYATCMHATMHNTKVGGDLGGVEGFGWKTEKEMEGGYDQNML